MCDCRCSGTDDGSWFDLLKLIIAKQAPSNTVPSPWIGPTSSVIKEVTVPVKLQLCKQIRHDKLNDKTYLKLQTCFFNSMTWLWCFWSTTVAHFPNVPITWRLYLGWFHLTAPQNQNKMIPMQRPRSDFDCRGAIIVGISASMRICMEFVVDLWWIGSIWIHGAAIYGAAIYIPWIYPLNPSWVMDWMIDRFLNWVLISWEDP